MYNLKNISVLHLEVTSKCQASCPMCARNMQGGIETPFMTVTEITLEQFTSWFPPEFIGQLYKLYMCGNLGDPVIAKDTVKIFEYCRQHNPDIFLSMNTNGSARNVQFWEQLADLQVAVHFGIDGLADTHSIYRIGTKFDTIIRNATAFVQRGGYAIWDMLVFDHNKHQVDQCRELSEQIGFREFKSKNTARFKEDSLVVIDKIGKPVYKIYGTERSKQITTKIVEQTFEDTGKVVINCKVQNENSLYVSATGNVSPCCWLDVEWLPPHSISRMDYMEKISEFPNLHKNSLAEIFDSNYFRNIEDGWKCDPLRECSKQCGTVDRFHEQFN